MLKEIKRAAARLMLASAVAASGFHFVPESANAVTRQVYYVTRFADGRTVLLESEDGWTSGLGTPVRDMLWDALSNRRCTYDAISISEHKGVSGGNRDQNEMKVVLKLTNDCYPDVSLPSYRQRVTFDS